MRKRIHPVSLSLSLARVGGGQQREGISSDAITYNCTLKAAKHAEGSIGHTQFNTICVLLKDFTKKFLAMEDEKGGGSAVARPYDPPAVVLSQWFQMAYHVHSEKQAPKAFHMRLRKTKSEDLKKHSETPLEEREDETSVKQSEIAPIRTTGVQTVDTSFETLKLEELDDARDQKQILKDFLAGGVDTPSVTLDWAMAEVLINPKAMKKLEDEVHNVVGGSSENLVQEDDLPQLVYTKAMVKETLPLHPLLR